MFYYITCTKVFYKYILYHIIYIYHHYNTNSTGACVFHVCATYAYAQHICFWTDYINQCWSEKGASALVIRELKGGTGWWGWVVMGGGRAWGCVRAMISADQATLSLIGTAETLGCLPPHSNEKPWPPLVSKVTKAYCNCTFSNGVSHARTPTPVMTITIMSLGSTGTFQSSLTFGEEMLVNYCYKFKGFCTIFDYNTLSHWNLLLYYHGPDTSPAVCFQYLVLHQLYYLSLIAVSLHVSLVFFCVCYFVLCMISYDLSQSESGGF